MNLIPAFILRRIEHRPNLVKIVDNMGWLFLDRVLRLGVGLFVVVWLARYLGPEQFGQLNYVIAFVSMFAAIAALGLNSIVVRDIVRNCGCAEKTLGTAFLLQVIGGGLAFTLAIGIFFLLRPDDNQAKIMVAILGLTLIFRSGEIVKSWFESQIQSRYVVWVENSIYLSIACIKILLILMEASVVTIVLAMLAESILILAGLLFVYMSRTGTLRNWSFCKDTARQLLNDSWPLILSGLAVILYMRIDQIMLGQMIDDSAVGVYSAAVRITEVWYFIPMAIVSSVFPLLIKIENTPEFSAKFQKLFDVMIYISFPVAVFVSFFSGSIIAIVFGDEFSAGGDVLSVHCWAVVFAFLGVPSGRWYVYSNLQMLAFYRTAIGAIINILLNIVLIKNYGLIGAAYATLAAMAVSNVLFNAFDRRTYHLFIMQMKALRIDRIIRQS